jgi:hypothetical protein
MTSDTYRDLQSRYYAAKVLGKGSQMAALDELKELALDTNERGPMRARFNELTGLSNMLGSDFANRDYTGSIEFDALRRVFETG